jgi:hypothetical protein
MTTQTEGNFDHTIYLEPSETSDTGHGRWANMHFVIEPPIDVHSDDFLNREVRNVIHDSENPGNYKWGDIELVNDIKLTHSDAKATYGHLTFNAGGNRVGDVRRLITEAFTQALNPLGRSALAFVFDNKDKIPE